MKGIKTAHLKKQTQKKEELQKKGMTQKTQRKGGVDTCLQYFKYKLQRLAEQRMYNICQTPSYPYLI